MKAMDELRYSVALWLFILPLRLLRRNVRPGSVHQPSARLVATIGRHCSEELRILAAENPRQAGQVEAERARARTAASTSTHA